MSGVVVIVREAPGAERHNEISLAVDDSRTIRQCASGNRFLEAVRRQPGRVLDMKESGNNDAISPSSERLA